MKKIIMAIIFAVFVSLLYGGWWDGGPARTMALGGMKIALSDATAQIGLFSSDFASGLILRDKAFVISLSPLVFYEKNIVYTHIDAGLNPGIGNYGVFWISPNDAVMIRPQYMYSRETNHFGSFDKIENKGSGRVDYAHSFENGLSAGLTVNYKRSLEKTIVTGSILAPPGNFFFSVGGSEENAEYTSCLVDLSVKLSEELSMAVSAGSDVPGCMSKLTESLYESNYTLMYLGVLRSHEGLSGRTSYTGGLSAVDISFGAIGYNINLGAQYIIPGFMEAVLSGGVMLGYINRLKIDSDYPGMSLDAKETGTAYNASLKCRIYLGENFITGALAEFDVLDYKYTYIPDGAPEKSGSNWSYNTRLCGGLTYVTGGFKFPAEVYANLISKENASGNNAGIRAGAEWAINEAVSVRIGASWPFWIGTLYDTLSDHKLLAATGAGVALGDFRIDLGSECEVDLIGKINSVKGVVGFTYKI